VLTGYFAETPPAQRRRRLARACRGDRSGSHARRRGLRAGAGLRTTAGLTFYLPKGACVVQPTQRIRYASMPEPDPALFAGKLPLC